MGGIVSVSESRARPQAVSVILSGSEDRAYHTPHHNCTGYKSALHSEGIRNTSNHGNSLMDSDTGDNKDTFVI